MDLAEAGAQGLALAVASGALFGAAALRGNAGIALAALAVVLGAFLYGMSLADTPEDHPAWPGWVIGAPVAALAYFTLRDVASVARNARARAAPAGSRSSSGGALALAGVSLLGPLAYIGVVALLAIIYLAFARRKRADEKHAGLRTAQVTGRKKLCLVFVDALRTDKLHETIAAGDAPNLRRADQARGS